MKKYIGIIIVLIIIAGLIFWGGAAKKEKKAGLADMTSREVALMCTTDMATQFHIHPQITIVINGAEVPIPPNTGVRPECMTSIHTHSDMPNIHVEAQVAKDFTVGDFFAVWGKEFSSTKLLDMTVTDTTEIVVTVNGKAVDTYENTIMRDKDKIVISYQAK